MYFKDCIGYNYKSVLEYLIKSRSCPTILHTIKRYSESPGSGDRSLLNPFLWFKFTEKKSLIKSRGPVMEEGEKKEEK